MDENKVKKKLGTGKTKY